MIKAASTHFPCGTASNSHSACRIVLALILHKTALMAGFQDILLYFPHQFTNPLQFLVIQG
ncbi:hypothetical protein CVS40_12702 [Lucilia cuprina]|nr:hypothetical protein CVS40_12702 [Lucilia cuprina]